MNNFIHQNKDVYNRIARHFSNTRARLWDDLLPLRKFAQESDRILDVGCGNGRLYQLFEGMSTRYVGVDQSEGQIKMAQELWPDLEFVVAEMQSLPFPDASFDLVYCIATFHHLPDEDSRVRALMEMKRVVKGGGLIILSNWRLEKETVKPDYKEFAPREFLIPWKSDDGEIVGERYYHAFTEEELVSLAASADLKLGEQYTTERGRSGCATGGGNIITVLQKQKTR